VQNSLLEFLSISWVRPLWWNRGNDTWSKTTSQIAKWKAESLKMWPKSLQNLPKFRSPENILRSGTNLWSALLADKVFLTLFVEFFVRVGNTLVVNPDNESFTQYVRINYKIPFFNLVVVKQTAVYTCVVCVCERERGCVRWGLLIVCECVSGRLLTVPSRSRFWFWVRTVSQTHTHTLSHTHILLSRSSVTPPLTLSDSPSLALPRANGSRTLVCTLSLSRVAERRRTVSRRTDKVCVYIWCECHVDFTDPCTSEWCCVCLWLCVCVRESDWCVSECFVVCVGMRGWPLTWCVAVCCRARPGGAAANARSSVL